MRLVQLIHGDGRRRVAIVDEPRLNVLAGFDSVYSLVFAAIEAGCSTVCFAARQSVEMSLEYDPVYHGTSGWRLLPPIDHPGEPARCFVTGTGLTHTTCAEMRRAMHASSDGEVGQENDSIRMYRGGVEGGRPSANTIGTPPEWFYKGTADILNAHGQPLLVPAFAEDAGEEAEIAGIYLIDATGQPRRIGFAAGNEFADHRLEKRNYLYLASSKLRPGSLGPELSLNDPFTAIDGQVKIERAGTTVWSARVATGEKYMCHSLANLEHHHFKYAQHRRPGDVHVHFFGADAFSFGEGFELLDGDIVEISFDGLGRPLRNPICFDQQPERFVRVSAA